MADNYKEYLKRTLHPRLMVTLKLVFRNQPADPIAFMADHLRHVQIGECETCDAWCQSNRESGNLSNRSLLQLTEDQIFDRIARFITGEWRKVNIIDTWNDFLRDYGDAIKWWHVAKALQLQSKQYIQPVENRKAWKTVRVFVSSTFRDMFSERDWLVKHVFPELRNWCAERKLYLVECDLRWGVPKDSNSREILAACLNEIDRCRDENSMPYFVGLLGNRYGWVPNEDEFPEDMRKQYCWIPGMSVTSLEVFTGAFWDNNPQAILMFRDASVLRHVDKLAAESGVDAEKVLSGYREADDALATSLEHLKQIVRNNLPGEQVGDYSCELAGLSPDGAGNYRLNLTGLRTFGDRVLEFLKKRIAMQFVSVSNESQSGLEIQHAEQEQFMEQRGAVLFGRSSETERILGYVNQRVEVGKTVSALVVSGSAGTGKSSLMANVALACAQKAANKVVVHFVGATAGSTTLNRVITRLWYECLAVGEDKIPTDADELKRSLDIVLRRASESAMQDAAAAAAAAATGGVGGSGGGEKRLVVFVDAVNQMDDEGDTLGLLWLPKQVPHNVRLIVSTLEGQTLDALRAAKLEEVAVEPLTDESRKLIVTEFFRTYNKKLSDAQVELLLRHGDAGRPLWLSLACEELRVFGTFELLDEKIGWLAGDLLGLVRQVIERVVSEAASGGDLMQAALSLIRASRFGLVESELLELLVVEPTLPAGAKLECVKSEREEFVANIEKLPMQTWAVLYLTLRQFLRPVGSSGDGRLDFYHRSISKVVQALMLSNAEVKKAWHQRLANFFEHRIKDYRRKAEELPYHLLELQDLKKLKQVLLDDSMFEQLYKEDTKWQLLMYWREVGGYNLAAESYLEAFTNIWPQTWFPSKITKYEVKDDPNAEVKQWVDRIISFSSQYQNRDWSAIRILGPPRVYPTHGDNKLAWAPELQGQVEFVELEFDRSVFVTGVVIYETYHAGGVSKISLRNEENQWIPVYEAEKIEDIKMARKFAPKIKRLPFKTNSVRIDVDGTVSQDWVEIDAVQLIGYQFYKEENDSVPTAEKTGPPLEKQWVSSVASYSSQYGDGNWSADKVIGPSNVYPKHGDCGDAWAPKSTSTTDEFIELVYAKPIYIAAICIFETYHAGGVRTISVKNEDGSWFPIYQVSSVENLKCSRRFIPEIQRPKFKSSEVRLEIDQSACADWVEIDAVAIYGYDQYVEEEIKPIDLIAREMPVDLEEMQPNDLEAESLNIKIGPRELQIMSLSDDELLRWCTFGVKLGWFLIDIGQFEAGEKQLVYVYNVATAKYEKNGSKVPTEVAKKVAESTYALIVLYRNWFTKFVHASNPESTRSREMGRKLSPQCYNLHAEVYPKDDLYFGEVVAACAFFTLSYRDEVIELFEAKNYNRGLVELYSMKGSQTQYGDIQESRAYHDKAIKLAYSEFGKFHLKTARAHQLYGQMLWNRWTRYQEEKHMERMNELFVHYWTEYEIFENIYGPNHPLTVRSRADNIIVLGELGRHEEAAELSKKQPEGVDVLGYH